MNPDPTINNDEFKLGACDNEAIRSYLALTEAKGVEIARMAANMAPQASKFDPTELVKKAVKIESAVRDHLDSERGKLIGGMNLRTLLELHQCLHGEKDRDFLAEKHSNTHRLSDPLAAPLLRRMLSVADVRDWIRDEKLAVEAGWQTKFTKAANGQDFLPLPEALKIVFPRAKDRAVYYGEYCKLHGEPLPRDHKSLLNCVQPVQPITSAFFPEFASKLRAAFEANKAAWTKKAQRAGGRKGGKKSAEMREAAANQEAARNLETTSGKISEHGKKVMSKNRS